MEMTNVAMEMNSKQGKLSIYNQYSEESRYIHLESIEIIDEIKEEPEVFQSVKEVPFVPESNCGIAEKESHSRNVSKPRVFKIIRSQPSSRNTSSEKNVLYDYACTVRFCRDRFKNKVLLSKHLKAVHPRSYEEHLKKFNLKLNNSVENPLDVIQNKPLEEKTPCEICRKLFDSSMLSIHMNCHGEMATKLWMASKSEPFMIQKDIRPKVHNSQRVADNLSCKQQEQDHMNSKPFYEVYLKVYKCSNCEKFFKNIHFLNDHLQSHHKEDPKKLSEVVTSQAEQRPSKNTKLTAALVRTSDDMYLASNISKHMKTVHKAHLSIDMKTHIKCYHCEEFVLPLDFEKHLLSHITKVGDRSFTCDMCAEKKLILKRFILGHIIRYHVNRCSFCSQSFESKNSRIDHEVNNHMGKSLACSYCLSKRFENKFYLKNHLRNECVGLTR